MSGLKRNQSYSRAEIHEMVGGSVVDYLPTVNGRVVAGCFRRDTNPNAPAIVLPGNGPRIMKTADLFASSRTTVPVFIKQQVGRWQYVGDYRVARKSSDPAEIRLHAKAAGRTDVSCVLHLQAVEDGSDEAPMRQGRLRESSEWVARKK